MRRVGIVWAVLLVLAGPLALSGWFALREIGSAEAQVAALETARTHIRNGETFAKAVAALQRERGMSAGFVAASGAAFSDELSRQRTETDAVLRAALSAADAAQAAGLAQKVSAISVHRAAVDALSVKGGAVVAPYTALIRRLLGDIAAVAHATGDAGLSVQATALAALYEAIEAGGLERATGAAAMAPSGLTPETRARLLSLAAAQDSWFAAMRANAPSAAVEALDVALAGAAAQRVDALRAAFDTASRPSGEAWFAASTARLDALYAVGDALVAALLTNLSTAESAARATALSAMLVSALGVGAAVLIAGVLLLSVRAGLRGALESIEGLAAGRLDTPIPPASGTEMGRIAAALARFRDALAEAERGRAAEAERAAADARRARAIEATTWSLGEAVAAAVSGDFSRRVQAEGGEADLEAIADAINELIGAVERGVADAASVMAALADADLTRRMQDDHTGAFARLAADVNRTVDTLTSLIGDVAGAVGGVSERARSIEEGAGSLSQRTEAQAASLEQTAATMEEMTATIRSNADALARAEQIARDAEHRAAAGGAAAEGAVTAVERIETSSARIADITSLIDSIAFQTNLLALNASVEAARAGEAGKGFAVVASEVRALAQRSADAARDISSLIEDSGANVAEGVRMVRDTVEALSGIARRIAELSGAIVEVAAAGRQQAAGVGEINQAIGSMDAMTQQNAALAEQSARAAEALRGEVEALGARMATFRIAGAARTRRAA